MKRVKTDLLERYIYSRKWPTTNSDLNPIEDLMVKKTQKNNSEKLLHIDLRPGQAVKIRNALV